MAASLGVGWQSGGWAAAPQAMWAPQVACVAPQWQTMSAFPMCAMPQYAAMPQVSWNSPGWGQQHQEAGLDPSAVAAFAQHLGIDPQDESFGWMAELALQSPLPQRWSCNRDPTSGCMYYTDGESNTSSWENPLLPYLRRVVDIGRGYLDNPSPFYMESEKVALWEEFKDDLEGWQGPFTDPSGRPYFVNHRTNAASSADPRVDSQYIYELQCSFLDTFIEVIENANKAEEPGTPGSHWGSGEGFFTREGGAEILTLDDQSPKRLPTPRLVKQLQQSAQGVDHKSTLDLLGDRARLFFAMRGHEEEAQQLIIAKKADARKRRIKEAAEARARRGPPSPSGSSEGCLSPNSLRQKRLLRPLEIGEEEAQPTRAPAALPQIATPSGPAPVGIELPKDWSSGRRISEAELPGFGGSVPPAGLPSPANRLPPARPAKGAILTPLANRPSLSNDGSEALPPPVPASPSLHKSMGGKETPAVNFLAKSLAAQAAAAKGLDSQGLQEFQKDFGALATVKENGETVIDLEATMLT
mmetsp:Transcript_11366/g.26231  ORF Transcript_11366/g.26231 Transcript_11366/m.26231 type:complete len:527 (-) Transcript_11366:93-1673(-)